MCRGFILWQAVRRLRCNHRILITGTPLQVLIELQVRYIALLLSSGSSIFQRFRTICMSSGRCLMFCIRTCLPLQNPLTRDSECPLCTNRRLHLMVTTQPWAINPTPMKSNQKTVVLTKEDAVLPMRVLSMQHIGYFSRSCFDD